MKDIVEKLQLMRGEVTKLLHGCDPRIVPNIAQSRPVTKGRIDEPKLYGRDPIINRIIHDITSGQYRHKGLTVIPAGCQSGGNGEDYTDTTHLSQPTSAGSFSRHDLDITTEDLIEQRLRSKKFLLVLDDIWKISNGDDWGKLLSTLNKSEEKGSMILVTTRFQAIAQKVETTGHSIKLNGLEYEEFRKLFLAFVFGDEQYPREKQFLLETADKIMEKLKGSPLAAKTVGRLLSKDLSLGHWKRVLKSEGWEKQSHDNEIMPALKLSYDFLPFHLRQCFSYSGLFPEDYNFRSDELIILWIGLYIVIPNGQNQTFENIGLSNLNELVTHGFFREEETM
ncbi:hypothetical protein VPH35_033502 [Triticum aestivum]|uniref:Putative disease resistance protein RGA3 n=1 Tax=Aegilops tauschii TaxID=37682 RepID=M8BNI0_AEGTA